MNTKKTVKLTVSRFFSFALVGASIVLVCLQANFCRAGEQQVTNVKVQPISESMGIILSNVVLISQDVGAAIVNAWPGVVEGCIKVTGDVEEAIVNAWPGVVEGCIKASGEIKTAIFNALPVVAKHCVEASNGLCGESTIQSKFLVAGLGVYLGWKVCKRVTNCCQPRSTAYTVSFATT